MARNKYPEETIQKILEVASRLFIEKGYEHTSIQDIINNLGGLSRGAIYHHFHSKEEILNAVMEYISRAKEEKMWEVIKDSSLNGAQKLAHVLEASVSDISQQQMFSLAIDIMSNPQILTHQLKSTVEETAKIYIYPLVLEGMKDGSLPEIVYPLEFTESFLLLANIWLNPMIYLETPERVERKCRFLQQMLKGLGIESEIVSETVIEKLCEYTRIYQKKMKSNNSPKE